MLMVVTSRVGELQLKTVNQATTNSDRRFGEVFFSAGDTAR